MNDYFKQLEIAGEKFNSRLFVGTGKFESGEMLKESVNISGSQMVTVAMKRANPKGEQDSILDFLDPEIVIVLLIREKK